MGKEYLIDFIASLIDTKSTISIINKIELLSRSNIPDSILNFLSTTSIIPLDDTIAAHTVEIRRKHRLKLPYAVIAATAIVNKKTLITRNVKDFSNIKEDVRKVRLLSLSVILRPAEVSLNMVFRSFSRLRSGSG